MSLLKYRVPAPQGLEARRFLMPVFLYIAIMIVMSIKVNIGSYRVRLLTIKTPVMWIRNVVDSYRNISECRQTKTELNNKINDPTQIKILDTLIVTADKNLGYVITFASATSYGIPTCIL
jgi:hypothetical protein